jgi:hypothetical protein
MYRENIDRLFNKCDSEFRSYKFQSIWNVKQIQGKRCMKLSSQKSRTENCLSVNVVIPEEAHVLNYYEPCRPYMSVCTTPTYGWGPGIYVKLILTANTNAYFKRISVKELKDDEMNKT